MTYHAERELSRLRDFLRFIARANTHPGNAYRTFRKRTPQ